MFSGESKQKTRDFAESHSKNSLRVLLLQVHCTERSGMHVPIFSVGIVGSTEDDKRGQELLKSSWERAYVPQMI